MKWTVRKGLLVFAAVVVTAVLVVHATSTGGPVYDPIPRLLAFL